MTNHNYNTASGNTCTNRLLIVMAGIGSKVQEDMFSLETLGSGCLKGKYR